MAAHCDEANQSCDVYPLADEGAVCRAGSSREGVCVAGLCEPTDATGCAIGAGARSGPIPGPLLPLLAAFGLLGLILASVGLYGVVAYSVSKRTREVGVRMALGADAWHVLKLVVREGMVLVAIGMGLGIACALAAGGLLKSVLYGIGAIDPVAFLGVPLLLAAVALLANVIPARRAARVDPMVALRYE